MCTLDLLYRYLRVTSTTTTTVMTTKIATAAAAATPIVRAGMIEALHNTLNATCNSNYLLCQVGNHFQVAAVLQHLMTVQDLHQKFN